MNEVEIYYLVTANIKRFVELPKKQLQQIIYDTCRENDILPHPIFKELRLK